ncbi:MAG TPA: sugar phosphate isomerase/epimerase [Candidatus Dormibacteraeota bacterium]|jgi:sugar phosphate isomerase/epimerase|nr:sugar phosphate isomerase/epimerase [Candidatus Dormibacteraeota bacterium]
MNSISRRTFLKTASASAACAAVWGSAPRLMANPLGLPLGLQLYSVRDVLPKDYEGTLRQLATLGYREVEAAGFFNHSASEVKQAMAQAGLNCVSAHYPLKDLLPKVDEVIQYGKNLGLKYIVCAAPMLKDPSRVKDPNSRAARESMTLDDWRWNADQFNHIGERVKAAGMRFAYHNHTPEFRSENGVLFYDELMRATDPAKVSMELDCGWAVVAGQNPAALLTRYPKRIVMLHVKDFKMTPASTPESHPPSTEMGHGTIDYHPIFEAAKKASIEHAFVEQEEFDMPEMEALKIDADYVRAL